MLSNLHPVFQQALAPFMASGMQSARFPSTSCSQCGQGFGPGDHGFSHCQDHAAPIDDLLIDEDDDIDPEDPDAGDDEGICPTCSGSGEGMYDGTTCRSCKGKGVFK